MASDYLLRLLHRAHWGFIITLAYGVISAAAVWSLEPAQAVKYVESFVISFNCILSGGIVLGTFLFVLGTEASIPRIIEQTFTAGVLEKTNYPKYRRRYDSIVETISFCGSYVLVAFGIFYFCEFPLAGWANIFMIGFACIQYGAIVYACRKIYFIAHMLNALSNIRIRKSVLGNRDIGKIVGYVNIASTLAIASIYLNATTYYYGPFVYHSVLGISPRVMLLLLVVAATPVIIIFNFYPRVVLRSLYEQSIDREIKALKKRLSDAQLTATEFETVMIDYDRLKQAEVKERLQLTLSDVPILVAIGVAIFGFVSKV